MGTCADRCLRPAVGPGRRQPAVWSPVVAVLLRDSCRLHDERARRLPSPGGDPVATILRRNSRWACAWHPATRRTARGIAGTGVGQPFRPTEGDAVFDRSGVAVDTVREPLQVVRVAERTVAELHSVGARTGEPNEPIR
jgi:hypothetical protein